MEDLTGSERPRTAEEERAQIAQLQADAARRLLTLDANERKANPPIKTPIGDFPTVARQVLGSDRIEKDAEGNVIGKTANVLGSYRYAAFFRPEETPIADKLNALLSMLVAGLGRVGGTVDPTTSTDQGETTDA
jgi:hypothetical protein